MPEPPPLRHLRGLGYSEPFCRRLLELAGGRFEAVSDIQRVLDGFEYKVDWRDDYLVESVSVLIQRRRLMCLDAAILARGLLEAFPETAAGILAIHRRDTHGVECGHAAAFYVSGEHYGAFARSNYKGLESVTASFAEVGRIASFYAREYLRLGFTPLMFGTCSVEQAFGDLDWRLSPAPLEGVVNRIMGAYRYQFSIRKTGVAVG